MTPPRGGGRGRISELAPLGIVLLMTLAFALGFSWLSLLRHAAYQSHAFDLGNMDQAVWNAVRGRGLRFTDMSVPPAGRVLTDRLAIHVEPLLFLLAPLYLVHSGPQTLLVLQACIVATGAIPAYLAARSLLGDPWIPLAFPIAYVLHPSLQNAVLDDFHAVTLSAALLLWAVYFLWRDEMRGFWIFGLLAMASKEEVGLCVGLLALTSFRTHRRTALAGLLLGVGWFLLSLLVIIPHFNPGGQSPYLQRYGYLGHGARGVLLGALRHRDRVLSTLTSASRLRYLDALLQPFGYIPILGVPLVFAALPVLLINMLSAEPAMYSGFYQYSAEIVPVLTAAAIVGIARIARGAPAARAHVKAIQAGVALFLVVASALAARRYGFSPLAEGYVVPSTGSHQQVENALVARIPRDAVVAAADEIEPHLSDRRWIYLLPSVHPPNGPAARYIVLDASIPSLPVTPRTLHAVATRALHAGFGVAGGQDGVLVLRRGASRRTPPPSFYDFVYTPGHGSTPVHARWGPLSLLGVTLHPGYRWINRSRPAISIETYWSASSRVPRGTRLEALCSPVYTGSPPPAAHWSAVDDSPTTTWLPAWRWPLHHTVHVAFLPCLPPVDHEGRVALAVTVQGPGVIEHVAPVGTVEVRP